MLWTLKFLLDFDQRCGSVEFCPLRPNAMAVSEQHRIFSGACSQRLQFIASLHISGARIQAEVPYRMYALLPQSATHRLCPLG